MSKPMKILALISSLSALAAAILCRFFTLPWLLSTAVTFGTIAYHLDMRLLVGALANRILHNHVDYRKRWFSPLPAEARLYRVLRVKRWKKRLPTYTPALFSLREHSPEEIAQAMCQAEIIHEINVILSFLPLIGALWWGSFPVFLFTSLAAAGFDLNFAILQRYNRPRILRMAEKRTVQGGISS